YYAITALFNLAMSLIWGIDTLFKLGAGLDIFHVMLTNAAFTLGSMVFEIPTGVVADTVGRRISLLLCLATLFVTTLLYVGGACRRKCGACSSRACAMGSSIRSCDRSCSPRSSP